MAAWLGESPEAPHLLPFTTRLRKTIEDNILRLHTEGKTIRQIAAETGQPSTTVLRLIKRMGEVMQVSEQE